ncbi:MAG: hypothetical protein HYR85_10370 [Planctomycetes bacterium]|nr:hypothetical protein [Planctomycetota bacterium]MBI3847154.1 hypothetical protein [Planctomycetota bacterium]
MHAIVAAAFIALSAADDVPPVERVHEIAGELAKQGFQIDLGQLAIETRDATKSSADLVRQQSALFPREYFDEMRFFFRALGLPHTDSGEALRDFVVESLQSVLVAYYQADRKAIVIGPSAPDTILAHELTHAAEDQRRGFASLFGHGGKTLEAVRIAQCLTEGEADLAAAAVMQARDGKKLDDLADDALDDPLQGLLAGGASLPYRYGNRFLLARFREGGWKAVGACFDRIPPSTEQIAHPEKLGTDVPTTVALPDLHALGLDCRHEDVIGEIAIEGLFLETPGTSAHLAAVGWDGDRVGVYHAANGDVAIAWRSVWDRDDDASQFAVALGNRFTGKIARSGHVVDATWATSPSLADAVAAAMRDHPLIAAPSERDAESTAAIEASSRAQQSSVAGRTWIVREHGVEIPIPDGWVEKEVRGTKLLFGKSNGNFEENVSVVAVPDSTGGDLDAIATQNREGLPKLGTVVVDRAEKARIANANVVWLEYHGKLKPQMPELHFLALLIPRGAKVVVVTATFPEVRWPAMQSTIEKTFAAVKVAPAER